MAKTFHLDPLLKVYNFIGFKEALAKELEKSPLPELVLFLIDFRDFKKLNLLLGIDRVNELLKKIHSLLKSIVPFRCTWGRFGPDLLSFFFRVPEDAPVFNTVVELAENILQALKQPFKLDGRLIKVDINIAISICPYDGLTPEELIEKAEKALIKCKEDFNKYLLYNNFLEEDVEREAMALDLISYAIENDRFVFYFQPYFYTKNRNLAGFEALVRIIGENGEIISPGNFIDVLEKSAYLKTFEMWSLKRIKETIDRWRKKFKSRFSIALNIAPTSFLDQSFLQNLVELLHQGYGENLVLEVTERIFIKEQQALLTSFRIIKMADPCTKISLDDFGTGVTSLKSLLDYPIDVIKIDAIYIKNMLKDEKSRIIVETLVELSKKLGLQVIAEGVETPEEFDALRNLDCDIVQGFLLSKPLPEEEVLKRFT